MMEIAGPIQDNTVSQIPNREHTWDKQPSPLNCAAVLSAVNATRK
jgi:hypothetical protein